MKELSTTTGKRPLLGALAALRDVPPPMGDAEDEARRRSRIAARIALTQAALEQQGRRRRNLGLWLTAALSVVGSLGAWLTFAIRTDSPHTASSRNVATAADVPTALRSWSTGLDGSTAGVNRLAAQSREVTRNLRLGPLVIAPRGVVLLSGELRLASVDQGETWVAAERSRLRLPSRAELELAADTRVRLGTGPRSHESEVELVSGKVRVLPEPSHSARATIRTESVRIDARGATFSVSFLANDTEVTVDSGSVRLEREGRTRELETGQRFRTTAVDTAGAHAETLAEQNRMFETALLAKQSGLHSLALSRLDELLSRHPRGPLSESARAERFRVLALSGNHARASDAARAYLRAHPSGFASVEAERMLDAEP